MDVLGLPPLEHFKFVVFCQKFSGLHIVSRSALAIGLSGKNVRLSLELVDRGLDARNDGAGPADVA